MFRGLHPGAGPSQILEAGPSQILEAWPSSWHWRGFGRREGGFLGPANLAGVFLWPLGQYLLLFISLVHLLTVCLRTCPKISYV